MKVCSKCGVEKDESMFAIDHKYISSTCKECKHLRVKERYQKHKDSILIKQKDYYQKNKEKIAKQTKEYRLKNIEYITKRSKEFYENNKERVKEQQEKYRNNNKEKIIKRGKAYSQNNKEKIAKYKKVYKQDNKTRLAEKRKKYYQDNKYVIHEKLKEYYNIRRKNDPRYRLMKNTRGRVKSSFTRWLKGSHPHTSHLVGCSWEDLHGHLESLFIEGMTWGNYGNGGWHIDHYVPVCYFDLGSEDEQRICFNYQNLRPLWGKDNLSKSASLPPDYLEHIQKIEDSLSL